MKRLIVNADDFGLTEGVNRAIIESHRNGIVTSTTLMANGMAFDSAVAASSQVPELGVGVHLNLTQGRPICSPSQVPSLVTSGGFFYPSPGILALRILTHQVKPRDVENELRSQIDKIASTGIRITHLDSHKHIHLLPPLFGLVAKLAREHGIDGVRCPVETAASALGPLQSARNGWYRVVKQYVLGRTLSTLAACQVGKAVHAELYRPEYFFGLSQTGFLDATILEGLLRAVPDGTSEIMCHPGFADETLCGTPTRLRAQRQTELSALTNPTIRHLVADLGIELISYDKLAPPNRQITRKPNETMQEIIGKG